MAPQSGRVARRIARALLAVMGLLALAAIEAAATTIGEKEFTCPLGGQKFKARVVNSNTYWARRLDLKPIAPTPSSVPWPLPVCPDNGFIIYKRDFSKEDLGKVGPIVLSDEYQKLRTENTSYFMLAHILERTGAGDKQIAHLLLRASWEAETRKPQAVSRYRTLALEKLEAVLRRERDAGSILLAAELERLLGRFAATKTRLAALEAGTLDADQTKWLQQIRKHAESRNSEPQVFAAK